MPRRGELSVRDLRAVYGDDLRTMADVRVLVLDQENGVPVAARIELADRSWGFSGRVPLIHFATGS
jgi:hypothetical protein